MSQSDSDAADSETKDSGDAGQAPESLQDVEAAFRATFEQSAVGMAHVGLDGRWLRVNSRLCDMLGYSRDELLDMKFLDVTHPDDLANSLEGLRMLMAGEHETYQAEKRYVRKDGSLVWGDLSVGSVRTGNGDPNYFVAVIEDITARREAADALAASELKFSTVFHTSPDAILLSRLSDGCFLDFNESFTALTGYAPHEAVGKTAADIAIWKHPEDRERLVAELRAHGAVDDFEAQFQGRTDRTVTALMSARTIEVNGELCILSVTRDVSAIKSTELELERRGARLEELLGERERNLEMLERSFMSLIDVLSHVVEMRDPYTAGHQRRVSQLTATLCAELGMPHEQTETARVAALIHDIGKMSVPTEILNKPGKLSAVEFELIKGHAEAGRSILASANLEGPIVEIIHQHHERCDGSGYPCGLSADQLVAGAEVLMVADVFESMMSDRPYRPALGTAAALEEIERGAGTLYNPTVCAACVTLFSERGFTFLETE